MPLAAAAASGAADTSWTFEPGAILLLAVLTWAYVTRWRAVARQPGARRVSPWRATAFGAAMLVIAAALISPVDALADCSPCTWSSTSCCWTSRPCCSCSR
jgi:cytochrome c oxidase assembly factor CtaG